MPELPEVETSRLFVSQFCLSSTITKVNALEQGGGPRDGQFDDIVIGEDMTADCLKSTLEGRKIVELRRRGKQMWFVLDRPPHPLFHFGMTGAFTVKGEKPHKFVKFKVSEEWPPKFAKLELQMSNGACLALTDPRRLARVRLREDPEASPPISLLGPDPLTHPLSLEAFAAALKKPTAPIKGVLLAQDRVVSGVGNWVADEVCFQACVHPGAACNTLDEHQVAALHSKLLSVCREACEARADYTKFPEEWLFHHRWGKGKGSQGAPCVSSGDPIIFDVIGGRTTAIVPAVQKKGSLHASATTQGSGSSSSSSAAGKKRSAPAKATAKARGGGNGKAKAKPEGLEGKKSIGPDSEEEEEQDKKNVEDEKSVTTQTAAMETGRTVIKAKDVEPVAKRKGGTKRKYVVVPAPAPGNTTEEGKQKKKPTTPATAGRVKAEPAANAARPAARGKKAKTMDAKLTVAPKSGRGGEGGKDKAAVERAKTTKKAAPEEVAAIGKVASKGTQATSTKRALGRRSPRLSG